VSDLVISGGLVLWAAAVSWKDWRSHRIPNVALLLLLVPALLALVVNGKGLLGVAVLPSLMGLLMGGGILLPGYVLGKMGAGDIKFAACLGLLLGPGATFRMLLVFAVAIGILSAVTWVYHRQVPGAGQRRIAAAPALMLGFITQLFWDQLMWSLH
jgi:prepilin peptidase CpaA